MLQIWLFNNIQQILEFITKSSLEFFEQVTHHGQTAETTWQGTDTSSPTTAAKGWKHLHQMLTNFIEGSGDTVPDKLWALVNCVAPTVYKLIGGCVT